MARYDPFEEMDRMFEQLRTRVWTPEESLSGGRGMPSGLEMPARKGEGVSMDLTKRDGEYVFVADLPGFEREEIDLTFADDMLTLVAESETSDERTVGQEGREGDEIAVRSQFARSRRVAERVTIPEAIVEDEIMASYRNGVLEVHLPLAEPADADDESKIDIID